MPDDPARLGTSLPRCCPDVVQMIQTDKGVKGHVEPKALRSSSLSASYALVFGGDEPDKLDFLGLSLGPGQVLKGMQPQLFCLLVVSRAKAAESSGTAPAHPSPNWSGCSLCSGCSCT